MFYFLLSNMSSKVLSPEQKLKKSIANAKCINRREVLKEHLRDEYPEGLPQHMFETTFRAEYTCKYGYFHERLTYRVYGWKNKYQLLSAEDVSEQYPRTI